MAMETTAAHSSTTPEIRVHASLGYKLILSIVGIVAIAVGVSILSAKLLPDESSVWLQLGLAFGVAIAAGYILVRRVRRRFDRLFTAAARIAAGEWQTPVEVEPNSQFSDEIDQMSHYIEAIRRRTVESVDDIIGASDATHRTAIMLNQMAHGLYQDIATFSQALNSLTQGAGEQLRWTEEVQSGMNSLTQEAEGNNQLAEEAAASAGQMRQDVSHSGRRMEAVLVHLETQLESLRTLGEDVEAFEATAREIGSVADTIKDIARRTNILSLNASLEASRTAGDNEGFSVLSEEIRSLSEDTSRRSESIRSILENFLHKQQELLRRLWNGIGEMDESRKEIGSLRERTGVFTEGIGTIAADVEKIRASFAAFTERISFMLERVENVHRISRQHEELTRLTGGDTRDQRLVGADELLHEAKNLDRISADLGTAVRAVRSGKT